VPGLMPTFKCPFCDHHTTTTRDMDEHVTLEHDDE
jgi:hypothetical protein